jgi:kynurenine formamidase
MTPATSPSFPTFDELPVTPGAPPESSWGVFGDRDELGCLNFLTPQGVVEAASLVKTGKIFRLDAPIGSLQPPLFGRAATKHSIIPLSPNANDDMLERFNTQEGSQWDGLRHVAHPQHGLFYGGVKLEEVRSGADGRLGIHHWSGRFAGRGVLIDAFGFRKSRGRAVNPFEVDTYTLSELQEALEAQNTELRPGTILLVRTGWLESYPALSAEEKAACGAIETLRAIGVEASREMVAWLWNNRVAAIATDSPAVEPFPINFGSGEALHYRALPLLGLPLGELFVLAPLAEDCARDGRYEFMLVSVPLHVKGGVASPANAVAIK